MAKVQFEVDGKTLEYEAGKMLIEATDVAGLHIPRFCYHPKLSIAANCRMCLVDVEGAPKPLPACATPIAAGMKVSTQSERARIAQEGTMEFLLINHPLDCPICDQGGECPLQEQSLDYGKNNTRYREPRRQVESRDIGPLIATWMTRCIHCTRCVRYGEEIAGVMELGAYGRGEHTKIGTFPVEREGEVDVGGALSQAVSSEVSGNVIDLCPVGALTARPSKYAARVWEMQNHASISPHDCVGANLNVQTLRGEIKRVVPRENAKVNSEWLADRDRFSYEAAIDADARLLEPMIKAENGWQTVSWEAAFKHAAAGLNTVKSRHGAAEIAGLIAPTATLEEGFLFQKLLRTLGSNHVDHRLRQEDFSGDSAAPLYPGSELEIREFEQLDSVLLVGSNLRKEQPLLGLFLRQAAMKNHCVVSAVNPVDYEFHFPLAHREVVAPGHLISALAAVAKAVATIKGVSLENAIAARQTGAHSSAQAMAESLCAEAPRKAIVLGEQALNHPEAANLQACARWIADHTDARLVLLPEANSAAAWLAGCVPHRRQRGKESTSIGKNAREMRENPCRAYLLYGAEPEMDSYHQAEWLNALGDADFVVQFSAFKSDEAMQYADVLLPVAAFVENAGTYLNCEGRIQAAKAAAAPMGNARPGWKILRVLGNFLSLEGFDHRDLEDVHDDYVLGDVGIVAQRGATMSAGGQAEDGTFERIVEAPIYRGDATVRRARALQMTADNPPARLVASAATLEKAGLSPNGRVRVTQNGGSAILPVVVSERVPDGCVLVPSGYAETTGLSGAGPVEVSSEKD